MYTVIWKGKSIASLPRREIIENFKRGTFGPLHSVDVGDGRIVGLDDFAKSREFALTEKQKEELSFKKFDFRLFGFAISGLCFINACFLLTLLLYAICLYRAGRVSLLAWVLALGILNFLVGFLLYVALPEFWHWWNPF